MNTVATGPVPADRLGLAKALALVLLLLLAVYVPALVVTGLWKPAASIAVPVTIGITFTLAVVLMLLLARSWRELRTYGLRLCGPRYYLLAILLAVPVALGLTYAAQLFPSHSPLAGAHFAPWMTVVYFLVLAPVSEETVFRGLLQTTLADRFASTWGKGGIRISAAAVLVAVLFGLMHLTVSVPTAIAAFILALLAGELRQRSGSLLPAFLVHLIFNAAAILWTLK